MAAVLIYKFGIVAKILEQFKITALAARVIIRTAVYSISTLVGGVFGYLANAIDSFCACIFGYWFKHKFSYILKFLYFSAYLGYFY